MVPSAVVGDSFAFAAEVGQDGLFTCGILGGDVRQLPCLSWGRAPERMDKRISSGVAGKRIDDVRVHDVGKLVMLLGEALDVLVEGLARLLPATRKSQELPGQV